MLSNVDIGSVARTFGASQGILVFAVDALHKVRTIPLYSHKAVSDSIQEQIVIGSKVNYLEEHPIQFLAETQVFSCTVLNIQQNASVL